MIADFCCVNLYQSTDLLSTGEAVRLVCAGIGYPTPSVSFSRTPQNLTDYTDFVEQLTPFSKESLIGETRRNGEICTISIKSNKFGDIMQAFFCLIIIISRLSHAINHIKI